MPSWWYHFGNSWLTALRPRRARRMERIALIALAACVVMTVLVVTFSAATIHLPRGRSGPEVAVSAALAVAALLLCGVAAVNAQRTMRSPRSAADSVSNGAASVVAGERTAKR